MNLPPILGAPLSGAFLRARRVAGACALALFAALGVSSASAYNEPVVPNATPEARSVLRYLYDISGTKILSGQMGERWSPANTENYVHGVIGAYPALYGMDFLFEDYTDSGNNRQRAIDAVIHRYKTQNAIGMMSWHAVPPWNPESGGWKAMHGESAPAWRIDNILTPGTSEHTEWMARLDNIAGYLKQARDAGVPIIWRPFHEMNGGWFWFGKQARFAELWTQMYQRFTVHHGLNNLLWCYSPNAPTGITWSISQSYPGHQYVDILALDLYEDRGNTYNTTQYNNLLALAEGRPIGLGEVGRLPDVNTILPSQPLWAFWCVWNGYERPNGEPANTDERYASVFGNPAVITRDQVVLPAPDAPPSSGLITNGGFENNLASWTITPGTASVVTWPVASGSKALQIGSSSVWGFAHQNPVGWQVGTTYRLTAKGRMGSAGASFKVGFKGNNFDQSLTFSSTSYEQKQIDVTVPAGATWTQVYVSRAISSNYGFADDISLTVAPPNLVTNGGFEDNLTGWTVDNNSAVVVTTPVASGAKAMQIGSTSAWGFAQRAPSGWQAGATYKLTASGRVTSGTVRVGFKGNGFDQSVTFSTTDYETKEIVVTVPAGATWTQVYVSRATGSGYGYVDDIVLRRE